VQSAMVHKCTPACKRSYIDCNKHFPKNACIDTHMDDRGYVIHRRDGRSARVVPYNMALLKWYHAHINVEVDASVNIVCYLFKYIFKGTDTAAVQLVTQNNEAADLQQFLNVKYTSSTEAAWGFLQYHRQRMSPAVEQRP
jgi:hypothetical protein